jgi:hypothetical protein
MLEIGLLLLSSRVSKPTPRREPIRGLRPLPSPVFALSVLAAVDLAGLGAMVVAAVVVAAV